MSKFDTSENREEDIRQVMMLEIPQFDSSRTFEGLEKQKRQRKDRHFAALEKFSLWLGSAYDNLDQECLKIARDVKESVENIDDKILKEKAELVVDEKLKSLNDSAIAETKLVLLNDLSSRSSLINKLSMELEAVERRRVEMVNIELRNLSQLLVSIAHELRPSIEDIIENERKELEEATSSARNSNAVTLGALRDSQIAAEETLRTFWVDVMSRWRS